MKTPDVYRVKWIDSQSDDGWHLERNKYDTCAIIIWTIGYLIFENKKLVRIALSWGENDDGSNTQFSGTITIPKVAILKMKRIKIK